MKRYFTFLIILTVIVSAAVPIGASGVQFELEEVQEVAPKGDGVSNIVGTHGGEYAILTPEVPEGKVLYSLTINGCPTWSNKAGNSNAEIDVYKWVGDFDISMDSRSLYHEEVTGHEDCKDLTMTFGPSALRYGYRYLVVFHAYDGSIGYWHASGHTKGWEFFGNLGSKISVMPWISVTYAKVGDLGPEPTDEPEPPITPLPTAIPTPAEEPTAAASEKPANEQTDATDDTNVTKTEKKHDSLLPVSLFCLSGTICAIAITLIILKRKTA